MRLFVDVANVGLVPGPDGMHEKPTLLMLHVWQVPIPVPPTDHVFKYRLVYIVDGVRVVGFDNELGKGDHRHDEDRETPYRFVGVDRLLANFVEAVETSRKSHGKD